MRGRAWRRSWYGAGVSSWWRSRCAGRSLGARWHRQRPGRALRQLLARVRQLHGPRPLLTRIDLEEARAIIAPRQAVLGAANREFLLARTHEGLPRPFAAPVIV